MNFRILLACLCAFILINVSYAFAITENFSVPPDEQKTVYVILNENQKVFFQIFVKGGENDDIRLRVIDSDTDSVYFNGIIRQDRDDSSAIFPAYKSELDNQDTNPKRLAFIFDNSLSASSIKNVDFTYNIFTESDAFEQTVLSGIYAIVIIVVVIVIVIIAIVIIIKKIKGARNK